MDGFLADVNHIKGMQRPGMPGMKTLFFSEWENGKAVFFVFVVVVVVVVVVLHETEQTTSLFLGKQVKFGWETSNPQLFCLEYGPLSHHEMARKCGISHHEKKKHSMNTCSHTVTIFSMINFCLTQYGT